MMLGRDERNFHGWAYRRFVIEAMEKGLAGTGTSLVEQEWEYTTVMVKSNMSNYSAWHSRTKLVGRLLQERRAKKQERMDFLEDGRPHSIDIPGNADFRQRNKSSQEGYYY